VALPGDYAIRVQRTSGQLIEIDELSSTVLVDSSIGIKLLDEKLSERGFCLAVMPGAESATVGGCIAADVHGKNTHKLGSFGDYIVGMALCDPLTSTVRWITQSDSEYYWTIGGFGVTGIILNARIRVIKRPGRSMILRGIKCRSAKSLIENLINCAEYSDDIGAWFSPTKRGMYGKIFVANWSNQKPIKKKQMPKFLSQIIFSTLGFSFWRKNISKLLSCYIYYKNEYTFPQIPNHVLFPLSGLVGWNKFFGKSFIERQFVVPIDRGVSVIESVIYLLRKYDVETPLCAVKIFRGKRKGVMSFANEGISLSVQYESKHTRLDSDLTSLMKDNFFPEYIAKMQQVSTSFPAGYINYSMWLDLADKNKVNSVLLAWLRSTSAKY
jgi:decaprenylphospho-beta-D-ribofuranose 2-oxidase